MHALTDHQMGLPFFQRGAETVARALLGQRLVRVIDGQRLAGVIVETEAYLGAIDKAAHTFGGRRTDRNASMWLTGGHAYVYFTYGMHHCMNVVVRSEGDPQAVLIRALEPTEGLPAMHARRSPPDRPRKRPLTDRDLCSGPAKLCQAMQITREQDGLNLITGHTLFLEQARQRTLPARQIAATPRIGVAYAEEWAEKPLRFHIQGNPHISKK